MIEPLSRRHLFGAAGIAAGGAGAVALGHSPPALAHHLPGGSAATGWHNVKTDYGAQGVPGGDDTAAIQNAINAAPAGGRVVYLPPGMYPISNPIVVPSDVIVIGASSASTTLQKIEDNAESVIKLGPGASIDGAVVAQMTIDGNWLGGTAGDGDGIGGASSWTDCRFWDLRITNVNRFGIGGTTGPIQRCSWHRILITDTGSDAIDVANIDVANMGEDSYGNVLDTIWIERFGTATDGPNKVGITVRGQALLSNIVVRDFGTGVGRTAIRFRSDNAAGAVGGERSALTNFHIDAAQAEESSQGIEIQSERAVHVSHGVVEGVGEAGVGAQPNANDPALHVVDSVHARNCGQYGFRVSDGVTDTTLSYCSTDACGIGFSIGGDRTTLLVPRTRSEAEPAPVGIQVLESANDTEIIRPRNDGTQPSYGGTNTYVDPPPPP